MTIPSVFLSMTIQYCSDLHLEMPENAKWLKANPIQPAADILVLAGDIIPFVVMEQYADFFAYLSDHFKTTYWLPGNHEYYGGEVLQRSGSFREAVRSNVFLLNNQVEDIEGVRFIFSTLWSHISPAAEWEVMRSVADYRSIRHGEERFLPMHSNELHGACRRFIESAIEEVPGSKPLVVTHHVPTYLHYPKQYKDSVINQAFVTELSAFIEQSSIDAWIYGHHSINAWIYGHHHQNTPEFSIGNTRMLTNQLGYVRKREYYGFRTTAVISL